MVILSRLFYGLLLGGLSKDLIDYCKRTVPVGEQNKIDITSNLRKGAQVRNFEQRVPHPEGEGSLLTSGASQEKGRISFCKVRSTCHFS
jgi:hypothetical protein